MNALVEATIIWQPDDYIYFKKCGEITISPDIQNISFTCLFCKAICLQTEIFLQHLQVQHQDDVFKLYENPNLITLFNQEFSVANSFHAGDSEFNTQENSANPIVTTNNACITRNQLQSRELKENCVNFDVIISAEGIAVPSSELNIVHDIEANEFLALIPPNQDLENQITLNPNENLINNITVFNNNTSTLASNNTLPTFTIPAKCISGSSGILKCLLDGNECEIGDGEDSGIMLVQSPCHSVCGGLSDCMSFTEDSSSKSNYNFKDNQLSPSPENVKQSELHNEHETSANTSKGKYFKTPNMRKALNNKDLLKCLLEAYRKNEKLWNPKHPSYKYNAPRALYKELSQPLLNEKKYSLTGEEIFGILTELRSRYRRELKKFEVRNGKHKTRLWYFEQMQFLREVIEQKRKEREKDKVDAEIISLKNNELNNRQILSYLLDLYQQNECLWNPQHKEYETCNKAELYTKIAEQIKENLNICMTQTECLNEVHKLRIRYRKELRIFHKLKGLYMPKLWCFDEMEFLKPIMEEKITRDLKMINRTLSSLNKRKHNFHKASEIKFGNLDQQLKFIEIYRSFNSLWDVDHPDYRSTNYRKKALTEMLEIINSNFKEKEQLQLEQLEKTIYRLRKDFSNEKYKRLMKNDLSRNSKMFFVLYEKLSQFLGTNLGPFRCNNCQQICKTYDQYKIHKSEHDGILPFICTLCGKGFQMPSNLTIHIRRHRRDFPYSCDFCTKSFATSTELNIHMRSHTGERPYSCECCDKTFKTWSFYNLHRRIHLNQSNFHCPICDKSFYERNRFTDHMNVHLNIRKHHCDQCGKGFTTLGNLKKHMDLHASVKRYKCQPCGKSFAQLASLRWHRKSQHEQ